MLTFITKYQDKIILVLKNLTSIAYWLCSCNYINQIATCLSHVSTYWYLRCAIYYTFDLIYKEICTLALCYHAFSNSDRCQNRTLPDKQTCLYNSNFIISLWTVIRSLHLTSCSVAFCQLYIKWICFVIKALQTAIGSVHVQCICPHDSTWHRMVLHNLVDTNQDMFGFCWLQFVKMYGAAHSVNMAKLFMCMISQEICATIQYQAVRWQMLGQQSCATWQLKAFQHNVHKWNMTKN